MRNYDTQCTNYCEKRLVKILLRWAENTPILRIKKYFPGLESG